MFRVHSPLPPPPPRRWLRDSIAYSALTGRRARSSRRMFIRGALARSTWTLDHFSPPSYRAPTESRATDSRTDGRTDGELQIRANRRNTIVILSRRCATSVEDVATCVYLTGLTQTETLECRDDAWKSSSDLCCSLVLPAIEFYLPRTESTIK